MQRLASTCPRLADLTLEACEQLAELDVVGARLRRLALRCCHDLAAVAADSSELRAFEYHGAVPAPSFLTLHGGGGACRIASCKLDFCGAEATGAPELARLAGFLQLFAGAERLHLTSARLGCGAAPAFPALRHLELTVMLPDDDATDTVATVTAILEASISYPWRVATPRPQRGTF